MMEPKITEYVFARKLCLHLPQLNYSKRKFHHKIGSIRMLNYMVLSNYTRN